MKKKQNSATEATQSGRTSRKQRQNKRSKTRMVPSVKIRTRESYMRLREQSRGVNGKKDYGRGHGEVTED